MASSGVINALFGSYDLRTSKQWRDEDMIHRDQEIQWLNDDIIRAHEWRAADIERSLRKEKIEHEHLVCEARAEQLHAVSEQCALLSGFCVAAMSNLNLPDDLNIYLLFMYGILVTLISVLLLLATVISTMLLLAVTRYASYSLEVNVRQMDMTRLEYESPFSSWWLKKCEQEQMIAYTFMFVGVTIFFVYLGLISWIQFEHSIWTSGSISTLSLLGLLTWQLRIASRWRYLLIPPSDTSTTNAHQSYLVTLLESTTPLSRSSPVPRSTRRLSTDDIRSPPTGIVSPISTDGYLDSSKNKL